MSSLGSISRNPARRKCSPSWAIITISLISKLPWHCSKVSKSCMLTMFLYYVPLISGFSFLPAPHQNAWSHILIIVKANKALRCFSFLFSTNFFPFLCIQFLLLNTFPDYSIQVLLLSWCNFIYTPLFVAFFCCPCISDLRFKIFNYTDGLDFLPSGGAGGEYNKILPQLHTEGL